MAHKQRGLYPRGHCIVLGTSSTDSFHGDGDVGGRNRLWRGRRCSRQNINLEHLSFYPDKLPSSLKMNKFKTCGEYFCLAMQTTTFRTKNLFRYTTECYRYRLAHALYIPAVFHCKQRKICDGLEELCVLLRRTSYLCRISGMIQPFFQNQFLF